MQNEIQVRLAENLKRIRKSKKLTQFELAEKADISEGMIKSIEICHSWPSEKTLMQISNALETDIYHFFMPVSASVQIKDTLKDELTCTLKKKYMEFVNEQMELLKPDVY